ncbi:MAG: sigma-54 dependent transcriptional regulator [Deltaproteobacteria bacterium]
MKPYRAIILIVDDDSAHRKMLTTLLGTWGYKVSEVDDGAKAIDSVHQMPFDLILMDIKMLRVSGIEALEKIKKINPAIPVVLMTAYASVETAIDAMKKGAYDYLTKPFNFDELRLLIDRATEHSYLKRENAILRRSATTFNTSGILGNSPAIRNLLETISMVAATDATVLINGESGTGKELVANAIHYNSERKNNPFIKINCAAITENLLESELFGHEKGAFTGADKKRAGKFEQAQNGSIFLDEVSEMSLSMQVKLLRVLQDKEVTKIGSNETIKVDVRLISATNKDLGQAVKDGLFREDLFYRLNVVAINVPPLRDRKEDIALLAQNYLQQFSQRYHKESIKGFTPTAFDILTKNFWKGNVRELVNTIERAVVLSRGEYIGEDELAFSIEHKGERQSSPISELSQSLEDVEKDTIIKTLKETGNNKSETARRLGITRKTLHKKLKIYGMM